MSATTSSNGRQRSGCAIALVGAAFEFSDLFGREIVVEFFTELFKDFTLFFKRKLFQLAR